MSLKPENRKISFDILPEQMTVVNEEGLRITEPGDFELFVGGSQPDSRSIQLTGKAPLNATFRVK